MISRDTAAFVRYHCLTKKQPLGKVAEANDLTVAQVQRILDGDLVPVSGERFVVQPSYTLRSRKLTPEQRLAIAHLICYGATLRCLSEAFGVQIRAIQHIKEALTVSSDNPVPRKKPEAGEMTFNVVAEARYAHYHLKQPVSLLAAKLFVNYKTLHGAVAFRTYRTAHGRKPIPAPALPTKVDEQAFWLYIYGADLDFIGESTGLSSDLVIGLVDDNSEVVQ